MAVKLFKSVSAALELASIANALVSPDGTGRLPALGWSSWNEYACDINEAVFLKVSDRLIELGLKDLGYEYVNIDDCWSNKQNQRDNTTERINVDKNKFPNGISGLAEKVHAKGLKLGIYSDAGTLTCGGYAGSLNYEDVDAATFAEWGVDYLKYDNCNIPQEWIDEHEYYPDQLDPTVPGYDYGTSKTATRYNRMRDALLKQDRTIQYSLCAWGGAHVERWGNSTGHSWRMWGDILPEWSGKFEYSWGLMPIVNQAARHWNDSGFWAHNDWDMLEVGNGNLTYEESRTHFALWAAFKSPLIIGTRLEGIKKEILGILSNKELLDFNQDPNYGSGVMPFNYGSSIPESTTETLHPPSYYVGTSTKGIHLFILNSQNNERTYKIAFSDIPGLKKGTYVVRDMWTGKKLGKFTDRLSLKIKRHDTAALRITTLDHKNPHPNPSWSPR